MMWTPLLLVSTAAALCHFFDTSHSKEIYSSVAHRPYSTSYSRTHRLAITNDLNAAHKRPPFAMPPVQRRSLPPLKPSMAPSMRGYQQQQQPEGTYTTIDASALDPTYTGPPLRWKSVSRPGLQPAKFPQPPPPSLLLDPRNADYFVGGPQTFFASIANDFKDPPAGFAQIIKPGQYKTTSPWLPKWWKKHMPQHKEKKANEVYYAPLFPAPVRREPPEGETTDVTLGEAIPFILCHRFTIRIPLMPIWVRTRYHYQICDRGPEGLPIALFPATRLRE